MTFANIGTVIYEREVSSTGTYCDSALFAAVFHCGSFIRATKIINKVILRNDDDVHCSNDIYIIAKLTAVSTHNFLSSKYALWADQRPS